jgi:hypothetical protein
VRPAAVVPLLSVFVSYRAPQPSSDQELESRGPLLDTIGLPLRTELFSLRGADKWVYTGGGAVGSDGGGSNIQVDSDSDSVHGG